VQVADQQGGCWLREPSCGRTGPGCWEGYRPLEGGLAAEWQEQECGGIGRLVGCAGFLRPDVHQCNKLFARAAELCVGRVAGLVLATQAWGTSLPCCSQNCSAGALIFAPEAPETCCMPCSSPRWRLAGTVKLAIYHVQPRGPLYTSGLGGGVEGTHGGV